MAATSLTVRLAAAFAVVVALTGMVFGAAGYVTTERQVTAQVDNFLRQRAGDIADGQRGRPARPGDGRPGPGPGAVDDDALVQILDGDGNIVTRSGAALPVLAEDVTIAAGRPSEGSRPESLLRTVDTADGELRLITLGLPPAGAVQVGRYLEETNAVVSGLRSRLIWVAIGTGVAAAALGAWMARRIAEPIRSLAASVDTVAATGDFSTPILVNGSDEVGRLAAGFDNLLQSLAASRRQQNQLVQDVAHELRTPLTSIRANVDLLSMAPDLDPAERRQMLDSVRLELKELTTLVSEIVEVAGPGGEATEARERLDLAAVVDEAVERFRLRTGRPVVVEATPTTVVVDRDGIGRVLANLLSNADKYSPADEPIAVTVPGDGWVHVADRGVGMSSSDRERAFDRFHRGDDARSQPGSGLGLAIVQSIVEANGGRVALADNPGGGTVASIFLPPA